MSPPIKKVSFSGGEISPAMYGRTDLSRYEISARTCRNMIPMKQGGLTGRPGTQYVSHAFNGDDPVRLVPFVFNETGLGQSYVLEFGNEYIAFYQNGSNIINGANSITLVDTPAPPTPVEITTPGAHLFLTGDIVTFKNVLGTSSQLNNNYYKIVVTSASTFTLQYLDGTDVTVAFPGWTFSTNAAASVQRVYFLVTTYQQADLADLKFAQSADVLTIVNKNYAPMELRRASATSWNLVGITVGSLVLQPSNIIISGTADPGHNVSYVVTSVNALGEETDDNLISPSAGADIKTADVTNPVTIAWDANADAVRYRIYKFNDGGGGVPGFIGETAGLNFSDGGIDPDFGQRYPFYVDPFAGSNYPGTVGFVQQRRVFANFVNNPIGFAMSQTGSFSNFDVSLPQQDSDGIVGSISGQEVNEIEAVTELKFAIMLTAGAEMYLQGNGAGVVTPSSVNASVQSSHGASTLQPIKAGDMLLFNQALGSFIRDLGFDFAIDGYRGNDITIFASHLFEGYQIRDWGYQKVPDSILWVVRSDGVLLSCTYVRDQEILAWAQHDFENGEVENVCAIPENGEYALYASILRVIDGAEVRYIERLSSRIWTPVNDPITASNLDCFAMYDGRNTVLSSVMRLMGTVTIVTGVNDVVSFTVPSSAGYYNVFIAAGEYTGTGIMQAVKDGMNAFNNLAFQGTINQDGKAEITNNSTEFILNFNVSDPFYARSIGATLGFTPADYDVTTGLVAAPNHPVSTFSATSTAYQQQLTLSSFSGVFVPNKIVAGMQIFLQNALFISSNGSRGKQIRLTIQSFLGDSATVTPSGAVPAEFQNADISTWSLAIQEVSGLGYLEGESVSVWADRFVVASPLNNFVTNGPYIVTNGMITLDKPYAVIYVGLPMIQDFESLDLETYFGEAILAKRRRVGALAFYVYNTRSFFCGTENPDTNLNNTQENPLFQLYEERDGTRQVTYDEPPQLLTKQDYIITPARWNLNGRIFCRNVDPVPWTLLAISPRQEDAAPQNGYKRT